MRPYIVGDYLSCRPILFGDLKVGDYFVYAKTTQMRSAPHWVVVPKQEGVGTVSGYKANADNRWFEEDEIVFLPEPEKEKVPRKNTRRSGT